MPYLSPGETVRLIGEWVTHPDYGKQLKVHSYNTVVPSTLNGIERYLASGLVEGVGPVTAKKIVERFGLDTLDIIQNHPDRLLEVPGIGPLKREDMQILWRTKRDQGSNDVFAVLWHFPQLLHKNI